MDSILLDRLLAPCPAKDSKPKTLRGGVWLQNNDPRYAPQFGSRLHFKRGQALLQESPFPFFLGTPFFGTHRGLLCVHRRVDEQATFLRGARG